MIKASITRVIIRRITNVPPIPTTVRVNPNSKFVTFCLPPPDKLLRAHSNAWKIRVKIFFADSSSGDLRIQFPPQAASRRSLLVFAGVRGLIKMVGNGGPSFPERFLRGELESIRAYGKGHFYKKTEPVRCRMFPEWENHSSFSAKSGAALGALAARGCPLP